MSVKIKKTENTNKKNVEQKHFDFMYGKQPKT